MRSFAEDYRNGLNNETRCVDFFNYYFEEEFAKTSPTHPFDFESGARFIELKARTCLKDSYETTMVGQDKIEIAKMSGKPVHFAFLFRDGSLWEIEYSPEVFEKFECEMFQRKDRSDHRDVRKKYCYIPVRLLEPIGTLAV